MSQQRVSLSTYLGNCLEEVASQAVNQLSLDFQRSPKVPSGFISPDFFRNADPAVFIAVTSTPTRNTFQKKKWRYVHEVFSHKQYYMPRPLAINLQLSPPGALQPNDEKVVRTLFDVEVKPSPTTLVRVIEHLAERYAQVNGNARKAVHSLLYEEPMKLLILELHQKLELALVTPESNSDLWSFLQSCAANDTGRKVETIKVQAASTNLRQTCFGCILVPASELKNILKSISKNQILTDGLARRLKLAGMELEKSIGGERCPPVVVQTVRTYGVEIIERVITQIRNSNEAYHIIRDLDNPVMVQNRVARVLELLRKNSPSLFAATLAEHFEIARDPQRSTRLDILDDALLCAEMSSTAMDRVLSSSYEDFSSFNRVQCMISARCQGRTSYSRSDIKKIADRVWHFLRDHTDVTAVSETAAMQRLLSARRNALALLGTEVNPVQMIFEYLSNNHGFLTRLISIDSCLKDLGIGGRLAKVERIYELGMNSQHLVKVLSGYKGGYEHKSEELAARGWILRYRRESKGWLRRTFSLGFIHEGDWDAESLTMLLQSGWDWQVPLEQLINSGRHDFESPIGLTRT